MTSSEALIAAAISGIAVPIFQSLWQQGGKFLKAFGKALDDKTKDTIFQASKQYVQNYTERHGILKVLGMRESISLELIYTAVQFLEDEEIRGLESVTALEKSYRQTSVRSFEPRNRKKRLGINVANAKQYLMVLGGPGTGKSTFLRRMGLEALKGNRGEFKHSCIPVLIELKDLRTDKFDIEYIIAEEFRICGFPDSKRFTTRALEQGKLLILFDALDEVSTEIMSQVIGKVQNFVDKYSQNRFIASCRIAAYRNNFRRFTDVAMAEFDDGQIQAFINNWFYENPTRGKACWQELNQKKNIAAKELTQTPLLLTLICLLYQRTGQFPANRATLYERALRILLEEWSAEKGVHQERSYRGLDTRLKETLLSEIAYSAFEQDHLFFSRREVANQIEEFLEEVLTEEQSIDGNAVLKAIEVQHGILVARAEGVYSFSHLTLQEYLTAQYIDDHRQIKLLVTHHLINNRWREVFLLVAGLMRGGADELLLQMEKQAQTYIISSKLVKLLHWANQTTENSEGNYKLAVKRITAIYCALSCNLILARNTFVPQFADVRARVEARINNVYIAGEIADILILARDLAFNLDFTSGFDLIRDLNHTRDINYARTQVRDHNRTRAITKEGDFKLTYELATERNRDHADDIVLNLNRGINMNRALDEILISDLKRIHVLQEMKIFRDASFTNLILHVENLRANLSDKQQLPQENQALVEQIYCAWFHNLQLDSKLIDLSDKERGALTNYLQANLLIAQ